jgi:type I restriction enzyme S subunit
MKRYEKYKPSGVEWIGEIPEHWEVNKLKYRDDAIMGQSPSSDDYNYVGIGLPFIQGNAEFKELHPEPKLWCDTANKVAIADDILVSVRAPIGAVNIADQKIGIGRGLCAIRAKQDIYKFLYYHFVILNEELNSIGTGSTYMAISAEEVKNVLLITLPTSEQIAIASFLDEKTAQVDTLISKKQKLTELLKEERMAIINQAVTKGLNHDEKGLKDGHDYSKKISRKSNNQTNQGSDIFSGVPEHWEVKKLKYVLKINSGDGIKSEDIDFEGTYPVYGGNGIMGFTEKYNSDSTDIIIGRVGAKCGNVRLVDGKKWISDNALVAAVFDIYDLKYVSILLESLNLNALANQNAQPLITGTLVKEKIVMIPPSISEQTAIVHHIETHTTRIDATISKIEKEIELLQEYRTALISEVVTGKICVL